MFDLLKSLFKSDNLMQQVFNDTAEMLKEDFTMFNAAVKSLRHSESAEMGFDIYAADKKINKFERAVRRKVVAHLAAAPPIDIPSGLILTSIVTDVERIGDYTKNIYELAAAHPQKLHGGPYEEKLAKIEENITVRFSKVTQAYSESDTELATAVMKEHNSISTWCDEVVKELISSPPSGLNISQAVTLALYIRHLKRISSHLTNIVSSVVNPFPRIGYRLKEAK